VLIIDSIILRVNSPSDYLMAGNMSTTHTRRHFNILCNANCMPAVSSFLRINWLLILYSVYWRSLLITHRTAMRLFYF